MKCHSDYRIAIAYETADCKLFSNMAFFLSSFGNLHISSVSNTSNGNNIAVDVEQCSCGEAYQGPSCEVCLLSGSLYI